MVLYWSTEDRAADPRLNARVIANCPSSPLMPTPSSVNQP